MFLIHIEYQSICFEQLRYRVYVFVWFDRWNFDCACLPDFCVMCDIKSMKIVCCTYFFTTVSSFSIKDYMATGKLNAMIDMKWIGKVIFTDKVFIWIFYINTSGKIIWNGLNYKTSLLYFSDVNERCHINYLKMGRLK